MAKITRVRVTNYRGIEDVEFVPAEKVTVFRGDNGTGKTTLLRAVGTGVTNDTYGSELHLRQGEEVGMILLELSDGLQIRREVTPAGRTTGPVELRDKQDRTVQRPQERLDTMVQGFGFDPTRFLRLKPQEQAEALLAVLDVKLPHDEAIRLSGGGRLSSVDYDDHPLRVLATIGEGLYNWRHDLNLKADTAKKAATTLREKVPADLDIALLDGFDLDAALAQLGAAQEISNAITAKEARAGEIRGQIEQLQRELAQVETDLVGLRDRQVDTEPIRCEVEAFKANREAVEAKRDAEKQEAQEQKYRAKSAELTALLEEVRAKPGALLAEMALPVEGLAVTEDGTITVDGLPISERSTGQQLDIAASIAIATLPPAPDGLRIVCVDDLGDLSPSNQHRLLTRLYEADVQAFVARVADGELAIITDYRPDETSEEPVWLSETATEGEYEPPF